jgi:hypothetical protein
MQVCCNTLLKKHSFKSVVFIAYLTDIIHFVILQIGNED